MRTVQNRRGDCLERNKHYALKTEIMNKHHTILIFCAWLVLNVSKECFWNFFGGKAFKIFEFIQKGLVLIDNGKSSLNCFYNIIAMTNKTRYKLY